MPWSRRKAITDITFVTLSQYLTQFILILRGFIFAKFLGPEQFGVYSAIFLFYTYGVYAQLGILDGLWRLVPYFLAQGDEAKGRNYLSTGFWALNFFGLTFVFLVFIIKLNFIVLLSAVAVFFFFNFSFMLLKFQIQHKFKLLGVYQILLSIADLIFSSILMFKLRVEGIYIGMNLALILAILIVGKNLNLKFEKHFDLFELKEILKIGFVNLLIGFGLRLLMTMDKFSVANFFDKASMGIYSVAYSIGMLPFFIPMALNQVVGQRMIEEYGRTKAVQNLKIFLDESLMFLSFVLPFVSIFAIAFAEPFIILLLPKYIYSLKLVDKLAISFYFISLSAIPLTFLVTINERKWVIISEFLLIGLLFVVNYVIAKSGLGLVWITYAVLVVYFLYFTSLIYLSYRKFYDILKIFNLALKLSLPALPIFLVLALKFINFGEWGNLVKFSLRIMIGLIWISFAIFYLKRKTVIISQMIQMVRERVGL